MVTTKTARGRVYNYGFSMDSGLGGGMGIQRPMDFALGSDGSLYILSRGFEFLPYQGINKTNIRHEFIWESRGKAFCDGQGPCPTSVAVDSDENVYIADDYTNRIFIMDKDGNSLGSWDVTMSIDGDSRARPMPIPYITGGLPFDLYLRKAISGRGTGDGELNGPSGLAFDKDDNLFVVDSRNHRVQVFTREGKHLRKWGGYGSGEDEFNLPWGIGLDKEANVYVADWNNHRVQKFTPEGKYLATFGKEGRGAGELHRPSSVAIDDDGDVYVTDWGNDRLNIYDSEGGFIHTLYGDSRHLAPDKQARMDANPDYIKARKRADRTVEWPFGKPTAVKVDGEGHIMVAEAKNNRIQVYIKEHNHLEAQFNL